jgi:hypothetical protein
MPITSDLTLLKPGARVKLRGDAKPQPAKPYPRGWKTVAAVQRHDGGYDATSAGGNYFEQGQAAALRGAVTGFRVEEEQRWLPVSLIEEIVP